MLPQSSPINYLQATDILCKYCRYCNIELLSSISTEFDCLVITGDLNFHTDDLNDKCAKILNVSDLSVTDPSLSDLVCFL